MKKIRIGEIARSISTVRRMATFPVAVFVCVFSCQLANGQNNTGRILGTVTDPTGAAVTGASVSVTDQQRGTSRSLVTSQAGDYVVPNLPPGVYKVRVEAKGFKSAERSPIEVAVASDAQIDFALQTGQTTETIVVTERGYQLMQHKRDHPLVPDTPAAVGAPE